MADEDQIKKLKKIIKTQNTITNKFKNTFQSILAGKESPISKLRDIAKRSNFSYDDIQRSFTKFASSNVYRTIEKTPGLVGKTAKVVGKVARMSDYKKKAYGGKVDTYRSPRRTTYND